MAGVGDRIVTIGTVGEQDVVVNADLLIEAVAQAVHKGLWRWYWGAIALAVAVGVVIGIIGAGL